jgi:oxygen-dependent protoporphyrinogen oxidase
LRTGCAVRALHRVDRGLSLQLETGEARTFRAAILALPAPTSATLVAAASPEAGSLLSGLRFASTVVLVVGYRREDVAHGLEGYGLLVPRGEHLRTTAVSFHSTKLEGRVPEGHVMLRVFLGGIHDGGVVDTSDADLLELARREMGTVLGLRGDPVLVRVFRWPHGTPQMEVGHGARVARLEEAIAGVPGLFLTGAGLRGTGLPDTIGDAQRVAEATASFLDRG